MAQTETPHLRVVTPDDAPVESAPSLETTPLLPLRPLSPPSQSQQLVGSRNTRILFYYFTKVLGYSKQKVLNTLFQGLSHSNPESYVREDVWFSVSEWCEIWKRAVKAAGTFRVLEKAGATCTERQSSGDMVSSLVKLVLSGANDPMDAAIDLVPESVGLYNDTKVMDTTRRRHNDDGSRSVLFYTSVYDGVDLLEDWGSSPWIPGFLQGLPRGFHLIPFLPQRWFLPDAQAKTLVRPEDPKQLLEFIFGLQRELFGLEDNRQVSYDPNTGDLLIDGQVYGQRVWLVPQQAEMTQVGEYYYYDGTWIPNEEFRSGTPGLIQAIRITKTVYVGEDPSKVHPKLGAAQSYAVLEEGVLCCDRKLENQSHIFATEVTYEKAKKRIKFLLRILGIIFGFGHMFRFRQVLKQLNYFRARSEELVRLAEARRIEAQALAGRLNEALKKLQDALREVRLWKKKAQQVFRQQAPDDETANQVAKGEFPRQSRNVCTVILDIPDSTRRLSGSTPDEFVDYLERLLSPVREIVKKHGGWIANTMGDGVLIVFGWNQDETDPCGQAMRACAEIQTTLILEYDQPVYIGASIGGVVFYVPEGTSKIEASGIPINTAARLADRKRAGENMVCELVAAVVPGAVPEEQVELKGLGRRYYYSVPIR